MNFLQEKQKQLLYIHFIQLMWSILIVFFFEIIRTRYALLIETNYWIFQFNFLAKLLFLFGALFLLPKYWIHKRRHSRSFRIFLYILTIFLWNWHCLIDRLSFCRYWALKIYRESFTWYQIKLFLTDTFLV